MYATEDFLRVRASLGLAFQFFIFYQGEGTIRI